MEILSYADLQKAFREGINEAADIGGFAVKLRQYLIEFASVPEKNVGFCEWPPEKPDAIKLGSPSPWIATLTPPPDIDGYYRIYLGIAFQEGDPENPNIFHQIILPFRVKRMGCGKFHAGIEGDKIYFDVDPAMESSYKYFIQHICQQLHLFISLGRYAAGSEKHSLLLPIREAD